MFNRNILELADYHLYLGIEILTHWRLLNQPQYYSGDKKSARHNIITMSGCKIYNGNKAGIIRGKEENSISQV